MDVNKYGGYSDMTTPYFMLVKSEGKKGKHIYSLESIPTIYLKSFKKKEEKIKYLTEVNSLKNPIIIVDKLLMKSILEIPQVSNEGNTCGYTKLAFTGRTNDNLVLINLSELHLTLEWKKYYKAISNFYGTNDSAAKKNNKFDAFEEQMEKDPTSDLKRGNTVLTQLNNKCFYSYLIDHVFNKAMYKGIPTIGSSFAKLKDKYEVFCNLNTLEQGKVLIGLIKLLSCKSVQGTDLSLIGLSKHLGLISMSKTLKEGSIIAQESATGMNKYVIYVVE